MPGKILLAHYIVNPFRQQRMSIPAVTPEEFKDCRNDIGKQGHIRLVAYYGSLPRHLSCHAENARSRDLGRLSGSAPRNDNKLVRVDDCGKSLCRVLVHLQSPGKFVLSMIHCPSPP